MLAAAVSGYPGAHIDSKILSTRHAALTMLRA